MDISTPPGMYGCCIVPVQTVLIIIVLLLQTDFGLTVRDGFQPLPLRPQDQIKGLLNMHLFGTDKSHVK